VRFVALQRFWPGRFTRPRALPARFGPSSGFGYPPDGFLPAQPRRPYFRPAALLGFALQRLLTLAVELHSCNSAPTGWFRTRPPVHASTSVRQAPPPLGFVPQECPSPERGCYPVPRPVPLLGFSSLGFILRPAWQALRHTSARGLVPVPVTRNMGNAPRRIYTDRPSQSADSPTKSRQTPCLAAGGRTKDTPLRFLRLFTTLKLKTAQRD
jgi:hypothetical protein